MKCKKCKVSLDPYISRYKDYGDCTYICDLCLSFIHDEMEREFIERKYPELLK